MARWIAWVVVLAACSQAPEKTRGSTGPSTQTSTQSSTPVDATPLEPPANVTDVCASDADCVFASYPDIDTPAGCCPYGCTRDVVTVSRQRAREYAYKTKCSTANCPPSACAPPRPAIPVCRDTRCAAEPIMH